MKVRVASASRPCRGFAANGDLALVRHGERVSFFAVVDVLGHGPEAAEVAAQADRCLRGFAIDDAWDLADVLEGLHADLRGTRGAAATLCAFDGRDLCSVGVGNVSLRAVGAAPGLVCVPGVVGRRLRRVQTWRTPLPDGARVGLWSDGISGRLDLAASRWLDPQDACARALREFGRDNDDATILIFDVEPA
jgi:negative regulator of sigma-B (phosphoserine phosphatase)